MASRTTLTVPHGLGEGEGKGGEVLIAGGQECERTRALRDTGGGGAGGRARAATGGVWGSEQSRKTLSGTPTVNTEKATLGYAAFGASLPGLSLSLAFDDLGLGGRGGGAVEGGRDRAQTWGVGRTGEGGGGEGEGRGEGEGKGEGEKRRALELRSGSVAGVGVGERASREKKVVRTVSWAAVAAGGGS